VLPAVVSPPETTATAAFAGGTPVAAGAAAPGTAALPAIVDSGATVAAASGSQAGITGGAAGGASTLGATAAEVGGAEVTGGVGAGAAEVGGAEVAGGVGASAGEGLTAAGAGSAGATAFIAAGAAVLAAKILPGTIAGAAEGAKSVISGIGQSTQQFFSGICFLAGTPISMMDGSTRPVESVELFDAMLEGGMCNGKGQSLAGDVYHYNGVYVTGTHAVLEDGKWIRVKDSKQAIMLDAGMQVVYILNNENHRIIVNGITFSDFEEISGSEFMSPDERLKRMNDAL
jgi:hypothetical protein